MWNTHDNGNGVVYANLVKVSDASVISKVVVDVVYKANGKEDNYRVSGIAADNGHFYEDLMTYTVNKDGEYELTNTGTKVQDRSDKDVLCKYDASSPPTPPTRLTRSTPCPTASGAMLSGLKAPTARLTLSTSVALSRPTAGSSLPIPASPAPRKTMTRA